MKRVVLIVVGVLAACLMAVTMLVGELLDYDGYRGEHADLYAVTVSNVFCAGGYLSNGEVLHDPVIQVVETDSYGRTLFFYSEYYDDSVNPKPGYGMAFVIMQKSRDGYAYYYMDQCYEPYFDTTGDWETILEKLEPAYFDRLKEANDWNQEIQEEKCAKIKINRKKPDGKLGMHRYEFDEIIYPYEAANGYTGADDSFCRYFQYCETDRYGRELYYVVASTMNTAESGETVYDRYEYAIVLNADGTCPENGIVKIPTPENSPELIAELKQNCGWNTAD